MIGDEGFGTLAALGTWARCTRSSCPSWGATEEAAETGVAASKELLNDAAEEARVERIVEQICHYPELGRQERGERAQPEADLRDQAQERRVQTLAEREVGRRREGTDL
jgi:hypothetical protein